MPKRADGKWQASGICGWATSEQGSAEGADQAAVADAVMLAVSKRLAPRYVSRPGASSDLQVQVQGMNLQRYAELAACSNLMAGVCRWRRRHPDLRRHRQP
jgi:hypothetical protein